MAAKRKTRSTKTLVDSFMDRFDGTIAEQPIAVANKAVLASLGLASQIQTDFQKKYDDLAKDGETVRDQFEKSVDSFEGRVSGQLKSRRKRVRKSITTTIDTILDYSPVAKSSDIKKLNTKLDKVLLQVAK